VAFCGICLRRGEGGGWRVGGSCSLTWPVQGSATKQGMGFGLTALNRVTI